MGLSKKGRSSPTAKFTIIIILAASLCCLANLLTGRTVWMDTPELVTSSYDSQTSSSPGRYAVASFAEGADHL